jgi:hypothetical protein
MSAQLADPRPAPATDPFPSVAAAPPPPSAAEPRRAATSEATAEADAFDDVDRGIGLLLRFLAGISVMVADVVIVAAVDRSWVLIPAFAVLLLTAVVVFTGIMRLLADGAESHS